MDPFTIHMLKVKKIHAARRFLVKCGHQEWQFSKVSHSGKKLDITEEQQQRRRVF